MPDDVLLPTPLGPSRVTASLARRPLATVVLGHGAGGGIEARDLVALATTLPARRITVLRVEQPWRVAGGRAAPRPARLDEGWLAVFTELASARPRWLAGPVVSGGRSAGARVACRTAHQTGAAGVLALAFPLHPPGRPGSTRIDELLGAGCPTLVVQGDRDAFGSAAELPAGVHVVAIPGADHGFAVPRHAEISQGEALELITDAVVPWIRGLAG